VARYWIDMWTFKTNLKNNSKKKIEVTCGTLLG